MTACPIDERGRWILAGCAASPPHLRCHQLATTDDRMPTALLVLSLSTAGVGREIIDLASAAQCIKRGAS